MMDSSIVGPGFPWAFAWVDRRWHRFSFRDLVAIAGVVIVASHASTQSAHHGKERCR